MPIAYYGSRISPHMTETPEGFLICCDVPINRIGMQDYNGTEIGLDDNSMHKVLRSPDEVFSPATLASFEGKPFTDDHPPESVTPDNIHAFARGHIQNVRRGTGDNEGQTIADIYITDPQTIESVRNGKREISCGYNYDLFPNKNGTYEQRSIRGNHVALVDEGRAGHRVAIKDSKPKSTERGNKMATGKNGSFLGRLLKLAANDENMEPEDLEKISKMKDPEEVSDEATAAKLVEDPLKKGADEKEEKEDGKDGSPELEMLGKVLEALTEIKGMFAPKESEDELEDLINPEHEKAESPEEEAEERETGHEDEEDESPEEQEPSVTISPEEIEGKEDGKGAMDSARQAAIITKQILQKNISDPKAFKMAAKDAAAQIRKAYGIHTSNDGYGKFMKGTSEAAKNRAAHDAAAVENSRQKVYMEQQNAYDSMNPNKNKEAK